MVVLELAFWLSVALLVHTHVTYPLSLALLLRAGRGAPEGERLALGELPRVSLVIAAFDEEAVIAKRVANAMALDYPRELLEVIVASDGSRDATVERAREAGADLVLDLGRAGKVAAQNAAVERASGQVLAFSDANSMWEAGALRSLVTALADPNVGYVCGSVALEGERGENREGAYWRYEMAVRRMESALAGITAGNGAIYAMPRDAYVVMPPDRGHDLCLPYLNVRAGRKAIFEPRARAREPVAPTIAGEWERKRRMMNRTWGVLLRDRILSPRGYPALFAYQMTSHRALRYASPFLHLIALGANAALLGEGTIYVVTFVAQLVLAAAALLGRWIPFGPFRIARYYVTVTASIAAGLIDRIRSGPATTWRPVEGTR